MHRSFLAHRYEIRISTAVACLLLVLHGVGSAQDTGAEAPSVATPQAVPEIEMPAETPPDETAPGEEGMQEEPAPEQQPAEQLTPQTPQQTEPPPPVVEPVFPWSQSNRAGLNENLFGPPLSGFGVNSRLTVNPSRPSVARVYSGAQSQLYSDRQPYNLKVGRLRFRFSTGLRLEANDNVTLSSTNPEGDLIIQPGIGIQGSWRLTKINSLDINMTFGKSFYMIHPDLSQTTLQISPGSQIALNVFAGDFRFSFRDRFSVQQDPVGVSGLNNTANAGLFTNDAGLTVTWDLNELILSLDLDHVNFNSIQPQPSYPNRAMDSVTFFAMTAIRRGVNAGIEMGVSNTSYSGQNQTLPANAQLGFAGLFTEGRMSRFITLRAGLGYQVAMIDAVGAQPATKQGGWYGNLAVTQLLNPWCNQTLDLGHEISAGLYSSTEENTYLRHSMSFKVFHRATLSTQLAVENVTYPSVTNSSNYTTYGGGIVMNYILTKKLSLASQYQFVYRASELQGQNYKQNRLVLDFAYQF